MREKLRRCAARGWDVLNLEQAAPQGRHVSSAAAADKTATDGTCLHARLHAGVMYSASAREHNTCKAKRWGLCWRLAAVYMLEENGASHACVGH
jgi:hypothetical protein